MKVLSPLVTQPSAQAKDSAGKFYPLAQNTATKIFVQATAPSGVGEVNGDIWIQIP
jgi:hypothetical protein